MLDRRHRPLRDLRVSVTDRCNLRCRYCMPREVYGAGYRFLPRAELLDFEEIERLARAFARLGVRKLRLTGGEPLLRRDLPRLVSMLTRIEDIEEVTMTSNGVLLARQARALASAGLTRVTVSLDALDDDVLARMSDAPLSARVVLRGIEAAIDAGLSPVKVNMVVRRGLNDHCLIDMARRFRHSGVVLRFIEYMDVGSTNGWRLTDVVPAEEILATLRAEWPLQAIAPTVAGEVATRYRYRDGGGEIGVIHSVSSPFCASCTRARLSADGRLFTCLFAREGEDLRALLRAGAGDAEIEQRLARLWAAREDAYSEQRSRLAGLASAGAGAAGGRGDAPFPPLADAPLGDAPLADAPPKVEMSYIGG